MTNFEYFEDDILKMCEDKERVIAVQNGRPVYCAGLTCPRCDLFGELGSCKKNLIKWLYSEHEEPKVDWGSVELDTKILVSNNRETWHRRYFAAFRDGKIYAWNNGATSWSIEDDGVSWNLSNDASLWLYAKLDDEENHDHNCTLIEQPAKPKSGCFTWG